MFGRAPDSLSRTTIGAATRLRATWTSSPPGEWLGWIALLGPNLSSEFTVILMLTTCHPQSKC
ncbi:MAG: hypothetical protein IPK12_24770 [Gemmatimonadetes bacterium]|nr:hypothetical protein [Gemmatimonadota bacterium]